jgi:outer membrane protein OmpA-like peptidoglycan-associated protein
MAALFVSGMLLWSTVASAQGRGDIDVQNFKPALGPHSIFTVEESATLGHLKPAGELVFNYSSEPLVIDQGDGQTSAIVDQQLAADLLGGIGITEHGQLGIHLPFYIVNNGQFQGQSFDGATVGDLTVMPKYQILSDEDGPLGLGLQVDVSFPTGDGQAFVGDKSVAVEPKVLIDKTFGSTTIAGNLGFGFRNNQDVGNLEAGDDFTYRFGIEHEFVDGLLDIGGELYGRTALNDFFGSKNTSPLEGIIGAKVKTKSGVYVMGGGGGGFAGGVGDPEFRAFLGVGYPSGRTTTDDDKDDDGIPNEEDTCPNAAEDLDGFEDEDGCPDVDNDGDGIEDDADKCPDEPEDKNGIEDEDGCPDGDKDDDQDGIPNVEDECPGKAEDKDGFEDEDGCPDLDNDGDGIPDEEDECADEAEDEDGFEDEDGCPDLDNDGDGIADTDDECPSKPGLESNNGCPAEKKMAVRKDETIEILEKVYFEYDKAIIKSESYDVLDQVGLILRTNDDIVMVEIQGHTDNVGSEDYNKELSEQRAKAVKEYLMENSNIEGERLEAKGYGSAQPLVPNNSDENRAKNRRVEFKILDQGGEAEEGAEEEQSSEK